jgi:hypothetical protein
MTDPASNPRFASAPAAADRWLPAPAEPDDAPREQTTASRIIGVVLAFLVGLAYGAIGTVAHAWAPSVLGIGLPIGLILGILGVGMLLLGLRIVLGDRLAAAAAAFGVILMIGVLLLESTGGSVLIPQSVSGLVWTIAPGLVAVLIVAWPKLPERKRETPVARPAGPPSQPFATSPQA